MSRQGVAGSGGEWRVTGDVWRVMSRTLLRRCVRPDAGRREQGSRRGRVRKRVCGIRRIVCPGLRSSPTPGEAPKTNAAIAAQAHAYFCALCASLRLKNAIAQFLILFFRHSMHLPRVAKQFLEAWMPPEFLCLVDWSTLAVQKVSGTDESLKELREDVLYRIEARGRPVHFYILLEHQSRPDPRMALRCLEYILALWRREKSRKKLLPMVIPLVVHPGPGRWAAPRRLKSLVDVPEELGGWADLFLPDAGYLLAELANHPMERLASGSLGQAVMAALQSERRGKMQYRQVKKIVETLFSEDSEPEATRLARQLWAYLLAHSELKSPEIQQIVQSTVPPLNRKNFMSTAERLRQEGRQEGRQEAIIKLLQIRHQHVPEGLAEAIREVIDDATLDRLFQAAATCPDIESFSASL
jgi:predicted transposase YdaD